MRTKSELTGELVQMIRDIDARQADIWAELQRLDELKERAYGLWEKLGPGPGDRGTVEQVGCLISDLGVLKAVSGN